MSYILKVDSDFDFPLEHKLFKDGYEYVVSIYIHDKSRERVYEKIKQFLEELTFYSAYSEQKEEFKNTIEVFIQNLRKYIIKGEGRVGGNRSISLKRCDYYELK